MDEIYQDITEGNLSTFWEQLREWLQWNIIALGDSKITLGLLLWLIFSITAIFIISEIVVWISTLEFGL